MEKKHYYISADQVKEFKHWLVDEDLNFAQFCKRCGTTRQYLERAVKGIIPITDSIAALFKKGGYEKL